MRYDFKLVSGPKVDLIKHSGQVLKENPDTQIIVGTDSQNSDDKTTYVTVIAYRYAKRGVHCIYRKEVFPRIADNYTRLFKEAQMSIETAVWIDENTPYDVISIDLDYNSDHKYESNKVVAGAKGWAESLGYKVNIKPDSQIATKAADNFCR